MNKTEILKHRNATCTCDDVCCFCNRSVDKHELYFVGKTKLLKRKFSICMNCFFDINIKGDILMNFLEASMTVPMDEEHDTMGPRDCIIMGCRSDPNRTILIRKGTSNIYVCEEHFGMLIEQLSGGHNPTRLICDTDRSFSMYFDDVEEKETAHV